MSEGINVIIPMGGIGSRFRNEGYRFPKPLINIVGRPMLFWVIDNLVFQPQDTLWIPCHIDLATDFQIEKRLKKEYALDIRVLPMTIQTRGAAETLYIALHSMNEQERRRKTISLDCDTIYFSDVLSSFRQLGAGVGASFFFMDEQPNPIYSYLKLDDERTITKIREKVKISDYANTGAYGFGDGEELKSYIDNLLDNPTGEAGEYYTSSVISTMINNSVSFKGVLVDNFVCVGTPNQLQAFLSELKRSGSLPGAHLNALSEGSNTSSSSLVPPSLSSSSSSSSSSHLLPNDGDITEEELQAIRQQQQSQEGHQEQESFFLPQREINIRRGKKTTMRFCFDLDNCLVTYPKQRGDYTSVLPIHRNIELVRDLKKSGHYIIIYTARRMRTHQGNVGKVLADVGAITMDTLRTFNIPYDELIFGKPYADVYVDDLAVNSVLDLHKELGWVDPELFIEEEEEEEEELGEGEFKSSSRTRLPSSAPSSTQPEITPRHFNTVFVDQRHVIKSAPGKLLDGEIYYYQNVPTALQGFFPLVNEVCDNEEDDIKSITIERIEGVTFSTMMVNRCLTHGRVRNLLTVLHAIHSYKEEGKEGEDFSAGITSTWLPKIRKRYQQFKHLYDRLEVLLNNSSNNKQNATTTTTTTTTTYSIAALFEQVEAFLTDYSEQSKFIPVQAIHGDPVFSNVLLDMNNQIKLVDMRGSLDGELTLRGDLYYDLSKVFQSLMGYDFIILNKQVQDRDQDILKSLQTSFLTHVQELYQEFNVDVTIIPKLSACHLFCIIPLHINTQHQLEYLRKAHAVFFPQEADA